MDGRCPLTAPASYATLKRRLPAYAKDAWRRELAAACAAHEGLGPASLVLYDAVSRWTEQQTGWSIRKFVRTARRYRTIEIQAGDHTITTADPLPRDLHEALGRARPGQNRAGPGSNPARKAGSDPVMAT